MVATGAFSRRKARHDGERVASEAIVGAICLATGGPCSIADLGAGRGRYVQALSELGYRVRGYDGTESIRRITRGLVHELDLTLPIPARLVRRWNWAISIEVGEHVPLREGRRRPCSVFLDNLAAIARNGLLVSWARPGQPGWGHVNCRTPEWVAGELGLRGWEVDDEKTIAAREHAGRGWNRKLLVFRPRARRRRRASR